MIATVEAEPTNQTRSAVSQKTPSRWADYVTLTKPRIAMMVLITVATGYLIGAGREANLVILFHTILGAGLVAAGSSAINQWIERDSDKLMRRTANRPLPSGRLSATEVLLFGWILGGLGTVYMLVFIPYWQAAAVAALTFLLYVAIYTPMKRRTTWNTVVGAIPGAMPPVIGFCAAQGWPDVDAIALFLVLFCWQLPHFMAIAWMYREEYAQAGCRMLPCVDPAGSRTSRAMILWCLGLILSSLVPMVTGSVDVIYSTGAILLGCGFLATTLQFSDKRDTESARRVLRASIIYLPGMMALLLLHAWVTGASKAIS